MVIKKSHIRTMTWMTENIQRHVGESPLPPLVILMLVFTGQLALPEHGAIYCNRLRTVPTDREKETTSRAKKPLSPEAGGAVRCN